jgi:hypothetical protein
MKLRKFRFRYVTYHNKADGSELVILTAKETISAFQKDEVSRQYYSCSGRELCMSRRGPGAILII